jgi:hypothetical protein
VVVQRNAATRRSTNDQLALAAFYRPPHEGAVGEYLDGFHNLANALVSEVWIAALVVRCNVFKETIEVVKNFGSQFDAGDGSNESAV